MTGTYILILIIMMQGQPPVVTTAEFSSLQACDSAAGSALATVGRQGRYTCVPK